MGQSFKDDTENQQTRQNIRNLSVEQKQQTKFKNFIKSGQHWRESQWQISQHLNKNSLWQKLTPNILEIVKIKTSIYDAEH